MSARLIADISVPMFKIAAEFVARGAFAYRTAIAGVRIEKHPKGGALLIGTDGHRMIVIHDEDGKCHKPITVQRVGGLSAAKSAAKDDRWAIFDSPAKGTKRVPIIEEPWPDALRVLVQAVQVEPGSVVALNPKYLAAFCRAARALSADFDNPSIRVHVAGEADPIVIIFPYAPFAIGVLMPMYSKEGRVLPAFVKALVAKRKARAK